MEMVCLYVVGWIPSNKNKTWTTRQQAHGIPGAVFVTLGDKVEAAGTRYDTPAPANTVVFMI
jgi:hypothetical protein